MVDEDKNDLKPVEDAAKAGPKKKVAKRKTTKRKAVKRSAIKKAAAEKARTEHLTEPQVAATIAESGSVQIDVGKSPAVAQEVAAEEVEILEGAMAEPEAPTAAAVEPEAPSAELVEPETETPIVVAETPEAAMAEPAVPTTVAEEPELPSAELVEPEAEAPLVAAEEVETSEGAMAEPEAPTAAAVNLVLGIFWKRMTGTAAFYSLLVSYVLGVILFILNVVLHTLAIHFLYIAPILFAFAIGTGVVITLLGKEVVPADKQALHWSRGSFHQEDANLKQLPWYKNYRVQSGLLLMSTFALILLYW